MKNYEARKAPDGKWTIFDVRHNRGWGGIRHDNEELAKKIAKDLNKLTHKGQVRKQK